MSRHRLPIQHIVVITTILTLVGLAVTLLHQPATTSTLASRKVLTHSKLPASSNTIDLLTQDWQYMPGVASTTDKLLVQPTGFKIVKQDGSGGQPNPPLNLYGTHLKTSGDFTISATLSDNEGDASLQLYDTPPVIADEFRIEPASIRLTVIGDDLQVQIWSGSQHGDVTQPRPIYNQHFALKNLTAPLIVTRNNSTLTVASGDTVLANTHEGSIFHSGAIWFGLDSTDGGFSITGLTASGSSLSTVDTANTPLSSTTGGLQALATAYRPNFTVGAAIALGPLVSDPTYAKEYLGNFGSLTPENALKAQFISPRQGIYDFQAIDSLLAIAKKYNIPVHGHTIAFSEAEPAWMRNLPTATAADRQSSSQILLSYVNTVMTHLKGKLASIDVINEPLDTDDGTSLQANVWSRALGANWMAQISSAVYAIDPNVKQYINENGAEAAGDRQDALYRLVTSVNQQGGHIYGVGLQAHVYSMVTDSIDSADLNDSINRFGAAGLKVRISEMDVTDENGTATQAQQYKAVFMTCINNPNCVSFTTWGVDDKYDVFQDDDSTLQYGNDLLFNKGTQTPAYLAIKQALTK